MLLEIMDVVLMVNMLLLSDLLMVLKHMYFRLELNLLEKEIRVLQQCLHLVVLMLFLFKHLRLEDRLLDILMFNKPFFL